ncbi:MAG: hypothetical protein Q4D60_08355 [Eubacteriales bacterium]|nr:hypothetical protein [Eubacteriales bacterium]
MRRGKRSRCAARILAFAMSSVLVAGNTIAAGAKETKEHKTETVYVNADANGGSQQVVVSEWLRNHDGSDSLEDSTNLKNIKNVKGDEEYAEEADGSYLWTAGGNDIYYQGESDEELPVSVKVTYFLDGKEISADELAGKSGKVKIRFDYENHTKETVKVDGEDISVQTPFSMMTALILPSDTFSDVETTSGKVISDGDKNIVVGMAFPGLADSLELNTLEELKDIDIPDSFEVTAQAEDFSLALTATIATTGTLEDLNLGEINSVDDLKEDMDELTENSKKLVDGSKDLLDGINTFQSSMGTYVKGVKDADEGARDLQEGLKVLNTKKADLQKGANALKEGIDTMKEGTKALDKGIKDYTAGVTSLSEGIDAAKSGADTLKSGAATLSGGLTEYTKGVESLDKGIEEMAKGLKNAAMPGESDLTAVKNAASGLESNAATLKNAMGELQKTMEQVKTLSEKAKGYQESVENKISSAKEKLDKVDDTASSQASSQATSTAREKAKAIVDSQEDLSDEQKSALKNALSSMDISVEVTGTASEVKDALSDMPSFDIGALSVNVDGLENVLSEMKGQAQVLESFASQAGKMTGSLADLKEGVGTLKQGADTLASKNKTLTGGMGDITKGLDTLSSAVGQLKSGVDTLTKNNTALTDGASGLDKGAGELQIGAKKLQSGIKTYGSGVTKAADGSKLLVTGMGKLAGAADLLTGGIDKIATGAGDLHSGEQEFDEKGIQKLADLAGDDLENVVNRVKAVKKADKKYQSFGGIKEGQKGSVKFIIETDPIEEEE